MFEIRKTKIGVFIFFTVIIVVFRKEIWVFLNNPGTLVMFFLIVLCSFSAIYQSYRIIEEKDKELNLIMQEDEWEKKVETFEFYSCPWFLADAVQNMSGVIYMMIVGYMMGGGIEYFVDLIMMLGFVIAIVLLFVIILREKVKSMIWFNSEKNKKRKIEKLKRSN